MPDPDQTIRVVWIASLPRTGSMWTTNVVRELVRQSGATVLPPTVIKSDEGSVAFGRAHLAGGDAGVAVLKAHVPPVASPAARCIVTQRDLRDVVVSMMRFQHLDFDEMAKALPSYVQCGKADYYYPAGPNRLVQQYATMLADPIGTIRTIARFLGLTVGEDAIAAIATKLSKENVRQRIADVEKALVARSQSGQAIDPADLVLMRNNRARAYDHETGFQTGHVSDYREGDWQQILTDEQKARIDAAIAAAR
jgi:hypothetical protein